MKGTVLFIDSVHPVLQSRLEEHDWKCIDGTSWPWGKVLDEIAAFEGVVIRSRMLINKEFIDHASRLKFIARAGAGMENIDLDYALTKGIQCINAPEGNRNAVAEHALGMLLSLMNNLVKADREVRQGKWFREANRGVELDGKTIGIIGFGNMGSAFAKKLKSFDAEILAYDPFVKIDVTENKNVKQANMDELFRNCDAVSLHIPLTEITRNMVNLDFLDHFVKPVYLVNTSRGKVVNTADVVTALETGKIRGAALDVLEFESLSFENLANEQLPAPLQKLISLNNVILTPHIAGWTAESHRKISEVLAEKIINAF